MKIYKCNISDITQNELDARFDAMSKERQSEVSRIVNKNQKNLKIAADHLCRKAISEQCGIAPEKIVFSKNEHGKPYAENASVHFNSSHSADMVICCISDDEIGIDIEKIKPFNPKTADRFATEDELIYINSKENGFFEIWTLKEAYFKCIGTGLGKNIKSVSFSITQNGITCSDNRYELSFIDIEDGYICSVCKKKTQ